jgi:hypothetical protein
LADKNWQIFSFRVFWKTENKCPWAVIRKKYGNLKKMEEQTHPRMYMMAISLTLLIAGRSGAKKRPSQTIPSKKKSSIF